MRIVGGRFRGRALTGPTSDAIRPTSDRLRESLFNILEHVHGGLSGLRVIDLFAGTGALAMEALSRGAAFALLVDDGAAARSIIRANVEALGVGGITRLFRRDARRLGDAPPGERFDLAFLDPPYARGLAAPALASLAAGRWLKPGALVVVEDALGATPPTPTGYRHDETRSFGDTEITFLHASDGA